jgi:hypothetical protein
MYVAHTVLFTMATASLLMNNLKPDAHNMSFEKKEVFVS